jgi:S-adenosylmethionine:tRNA ribosyltransferase-isomerase
MKTDLLDYALPEGLIASFPTERRDQARMLVLGESGNEHRNVGELSELIVEGALVVVNDSRVLHARLRGVRRETGGRAEVFLLRRLERDSGSELWATARMSAPRPTP